MKTEIPKCDRSWLDVHLVTMDPQNEGAYGPLKNHAIGVAQGKISFIAAMSQVDPSALTGELIEGRGRWLTPGLIDCHTHLIYGGHRANEFEQRQQGVGYEEIARAGGGILSTVRSTRALSEEVLMDQARPRLETLMNEGVTTVEIKSGYGLSVADELKMLRAARGLALQYPVNIRTTLLAAHVVPPEFKEHPDAYVDLICEDLIPQVAQQQLAEAVDVFCEDIAFSIEQTERIFQVALDWNLGIKVHAEQLSAGGAAALAARYGAWSADHLEYLDEPGVLALQAAGTVAILLPGAFYFLRETRKPPVDLLRRHGVPMALATDLNPGTSPLASLQLMMNMGCTLFGLTPEEALAATTRNAARGLGLNERLGTLTVGMDADMLLWEIEHPAQLAYQLGGLRLAQRIYRGEIRHVSSP